MRNYTILVVDDRESNIIALKEVLKVIKDIDLIEANSGKQALELLLEQEIDLVLLDIQMPNMDGFEVATYMKKIEYTKNIPIIFLTAFFTKDEFIKRGYQIGAVDYLLKPIDENQLINKISLYTKLYYREKSLEEAEYELKVIFENINMAVALFGLDGTIKKSNSHFDNLKDREQIFNLLVAYPYRDYSKILELSENFFETNINFIYNKKSNKAQYVLILLNDITIKLKEQKERLEQDEYINQQSKFIAMGETVAMIAHQWRQPLNAINSTIVNLKMKYMLDSINRETIIESLDFMENKVSMLSEVITDFLGFSKQQVIKDNFSINKTIDSIIGLFKNRLEKNSIKIKQIGDDIEISGYKGLMEQIFINLLTNSIEAFEDSKLDSVDRLIEIQSYQNEQELHIIFKDNAGGISDNLLEKLCNPYFTTKESGTGLGLYMVKRILQRAFGGDLNIKNSETGLQIDLIIEKFKV